MREYRPKKASKADDLSTGIADKIRQDNNNIVTSHLKFFSFLSTIDWIMLKNMLDTFNVADKVDNDTSKDKENASRVDNPQQMQTRQTTQIRQAQQMWAM